MAIKMNIHKLAQLTGLQPLNEAKVSPLPEDLATLKTEIMEREQQWQEETLSMLDSILSRYKLKIWLDSQNDQIVWVKPEATWTTVLELLRSTALSVGVLSREAVLELMAPAHYKAPRQAVQAALAWIRHWEASGCCCYGAPHAGTCCPGWFVNAETEKIERCDSCNIFVSDAEAEKAAQTDRSAA